MCPGPFATRIEGRECWLFCYRVRWGHDDKTGTHVYRGVCVWFNGAAVVRRDSCCCMSLSGSDCQTGCCQTQAGCSGILSSRDGHLAQVSSLARFIGLSQPVSCGCSGFCTMPPPQASCQRQRHGLPSPPLLSPPPPLSGCLREVAGRILWHLSNTFGPDLMNRTKLQDLPISTTNTKKKPMASHITSGGGKR